MDRASSAYVVIARRYRPQRFDQVLGQDATVATLKNAILQGRVAQAYLFCGTRGTGKTTLARLLAKAINCPHRGHHADPCGECTTCREIAAGISLDVLEIDGASNRGIDDIRTLTESAPYAAAGGGFKVTIIDEVHMLTKEAFNALLKTLEEPPPNLKFIFATTEPHKVPATILSRCQRFDLARIPTEVLLKKLRVIAHEMKRQITDEALYLIAAQAEGSFRDSESLLDQVLAYQAEGAIEAASAAIALGLAPRQLWFHLDQAVQNQSLEEALEIAQAVMHTGIDITQALEQLLEHIRCHLLMALGKLPLAMPEEWVARYRENSGAYHREQLLQLLDELSLLWQQARQQTPSLWTLEYALLLVVRSRTRLSLETLAHRLLELEGRLSASQGGGVAASVASLSASIDQRSKTAPVQTPAVELRDVALKLEQKGRSSGEKPQSAEREGQREPTRSAAASQPPVAAESAPALFSAALSAVVAPSAPSAPSVKPKAQRQQNPVQQNSVQQNPEQQNPVQQNSVQQNSGKQEPIQETAAEQATSEQMAPGKLDTLMRFAAVELEGVLSPPPKR